MGYQLGRSTASVHQSSPLRSRLDHPKRSHFTRAKTKLCKKCCASEREPAPPPSPKRGVPAFEEAPHAHSSFPCGVEYPVLAKYRVCSTCPVLLHDNKPVP